MHLEQYRLNKDKTFFRKKLDETTAELKITSRLLAEEKQKTDNLLFQMLPQKVADELKNGRTVKAGELIQGQSILV